MIDDVKLYYHVHGVETCVATLEVHTSKGTFIKTLDFSGNSISANLRGAVSIVNELQEMLGQSPQGYVEVKGKRGKRS